MTLPAQKVQYAQNILSKIFYGCVLIFFAIIMWFSVFYITTGYDTLTRWFLSMSDCFYRNTFWAHDFFTPTIKDKGNHYAGIAIVICLAGIIYICTGRKKYFLQKAIPATTTYDLSSWKWYLAVVVMASGIWYWGQGLVKPSADEIFSAVNCAELPHFQVLAYYMLPNNHVYFNFLNSFVTQWTNIDAVITGRIISLFAYTGVLLCIFHWLSKVFKNNTWAFIGLIVAALQFHPWAFGFQARGYELQLLCCWIAFLTIFNYVNTGNTSLLRINTIACILGYAFIPTFLYYFLAQTVFIILYQLFYRNRDLTPWKYQAITIAIVFLLYLPAICFSGLSALATNDYVKSSNTNFSNYFYVWCGTTKYFLNYTFSFLINENNPINFILFLTPLALFFFRSKQHKMAGMFYTVLWIAWAIICFAMQRNPFTRNMIMHFSLTMAFVLYTVYSIVELLLRKVKNATVNASLKTILLGAPAIALCIHLATWGKEHVSSCLYFMDVNVMYQDYASDIKPIPPGSSVACSNERYCFYYYCRKGPYQIDRCPTGAEDYFINVEGEPLPEIISKNYLLERHGHEATEIYKHK